MITTNVKLDQLINAHQKFPLVFLIGPYGAGKSMLINDYQAFLKKLENAHLEIMSLKNRENMVQNLNHLYLQNKFNRVSTTYLMLDGGVINQQSMNAIRQLVGLPNFHIVINCNDHQLLTNHLKEQFKGKFAIVEMMTYSFADFLNHHSISPTLSALHEYLNTGGFPFSQELHTKQLRNRYLNEVVSTSILNSIPSPDTLMRPLLVKNILLMLATHYDQTWNISKITNKLAKQNIKASNKTIASYIEFLTDCFLIYPCYEFNYRKEQVKHTNTYYFPVDPLLKSLGANHALALSTDNLRAVIFLELRRRGYSVYSGTAGKSAITFIAIRGIQKYAIQFIYSYNNKGSYNKKINALKRLPVSYQPLLIIANTDKSQLIRHSGIPEVGLIQWLTK